MDQSIKERLALLQKGDIPQGYRKTKAGIMPIDWDDTIRAKDVFRNYTDKKHNGELEILASTQENGIVPRSQIGIDIQCSDEGIAGYKKVSQGDFVISLRSFQGGVEYSQYEGIVSPAYTVLKPTKSISDGYYQNYFKTSGFIQRLNSAVYGIRDGKQIGYQDFGNLYIHYPPVEEQKKIAQILAHCDKVIELKQRLIEEEKKKNQWLLEFAYKLSGAQYTKISLKNCGKWFSGGTPDKRNNDYWNHGTIKWVSSQEVKGTHIQDTTYKITHKAIAESTTTIAPAYSLLLVTRSGILKHSIPVAYISEDMAINQDIKALIPKEGIDYYYLLSYLKYKEKELVSTYVKTGTTVESIIMNLFLKLEVPFPSYEEQIRISNVIRCNDKKLQALAEEVECWKEKKKALMQFLLTGTVRVKPNEEQR